MNQCARVRDKNSPKQQRLNFRLKKSFLDDMKVGWVGLGGTHSRIKSFLILKWKNQTEFCRYRVHCKFMRTASSVDKIYIDGSLVIQLDQIKGASDSGALYP